jgi:osmotically-inducible protein OsmY
VQDDHTAEKTAQEIKAAARDMLRMGSRWAHSALDWFDERRHEMNNRTRDERDYSDRSRGTSPSYSTAGQGDWQERDRQARQERQYGSRREQLQGRSDRDIQGDYSGGGYDQVGERDWNREYGERDFGQRRTYGRGREGYSPQTQSPDDESRRGVSSSDLGYGSSGGYGAESSYGGYGAGYGYGYGAGPGGVGYGAPGYGAGSSYAEPRYHGDFQSRAIGEEEGYGGFRRDVGSEFGRDYSQSGGYAGRRGLEGQGQSWRSQQAYGATQGYGERSYGSDLGYGRSGQPYGERGYRDYGQSDLSQRGSRDYSMQRSGYGAQGELRDSSSQLGRSYRGIGPRNYTRSDERIREDLNERLTDAHDIDASMITVEVSNGVATLTGTVNERWMKHRAEDIADGCTGVRDVRNNIQVQASTQSEFGGQYGSSQTSYGSTSQQGASGQYASSQQGASSQGSSQAGSASGSSQSGSSSPGGKSGTQSDTGTSAGSRGTSTGPNV